MIGAGGRACLSFVVAPPPREVALALFEVLTALPMGGVWSWLAPAGLFLGLLVAGTGLGWAGTTGGGAAATADRAGLGLGVRDR